MMKHLLISIAILVGTFLLLAGTKFSQFASMMAMAENMQMPPTYVSTSNAELKDWEITLFSVATLEAVQGTTITAEIPGRVVSINFEAGSEVKAGTLLVQQDISTEKAQLRAAEASAALAKTEFERARELIKQRAVSQAQLDSASARYEEAVAQAEAIQLNIEKKSIRAPFTGRLGIRLINIGQDLRQGAAVVSLQAATPIFSNFYLPQRYLGKLARGQEVRVTTDANPDRIYKGKISAINPQVDQTTRSVLVQATLANEDKSLVPGMFAKANVVMPTKDSVIVVPITAVAYATYGDSVFVVETKKSESGAEQLVANQQFVQVGRKRGDYVEIVEGLEAGATVVSAGVFKLMNGAPVAVNNETRPEFKVDPTPADA